MKLYDLIWLVPVFPLIGAAFNGFVSNRLGLKKSVTHTVPCVSSIKFDGLISRCETPCSWA